MKKLLSIIVMAIISLTFISVPVFASCPEGTTPVSLIGDNDKIVSGTNGEKCLQNDNDGSNTMNIVYLVIDIMTIGVTILAVIGIVIAGIYYLTASGDEGKVRKAKQRISEIVIGVAIYAIIYALLKWLLPSFGS